MVTCPEGSIRHTCVAWSNEIVAQSFDLISMFSKARWMQQTVMTTVTLSNVFGVTAILNITEKQNLECVQQLRSLLLELCSEHATDQTNTLIRSLLSDDSQCIGLLINEHIVNIPAQISVPLLESLRYFLLQLNFLSADSPLMLQTLVHKIFQGKYA